jgi:hypothetical protein
MAFLSVCLRQSQFVKRLFRGIFLDPVPAPWDYIFSNRYRGVIDRVPGSSGALISMDECSFVELVELPTAQLRPLIQRSNLWQKIHGQIKTATLMRLSGRFSNQQSSVNSTVHLSNQPQMLSPSTTRVPTSQVQVPTAQQDQLPNQHQQLIQGSPVQAQPAPPPPSSNGKAAK